MGMILVKGKHDDLHLRPLPPQSLRRLNPVVDDVTFSDSSKVHERDYGYGPCVEWGYDGFVGSLEIGGIGVPK